MAFGDVNLSEEPIREYQAGAGGWPTIRYFNTATGYMGAPYKKKTSGSMCDELGNEKFMAAYVTEYGLASICSISDPATCSEKAGFCRGVVAARPNTRPAETHPPFLFGLTGLPFFCFSPPPANRASVASPAEDNLETPDMYLSMYLSIYKYVSG